MNLNKLMQDIKPHAIVVLVFFVVGFLYYKETFNGKIHKEDDVTQGLLKGTELVKYTDKDGEFPGWTNSIFSGMPSTLIKGKPSGNYVKSYNYLTPFNSTAYPFRILFLSFIGFYLLMNAFKVKPTYGALAAIAYGFATYSISSVEAAHYTKVLAMALIPALLASLHWLFSGKYLLGGVTLAFNMALQVYYFHYQITFYTIICLLVMGIYYLVKLIQEKNIKQLLIATLISVVSVGAGVSANITKIINTSKFADNTMRGGNDMAKANNGYNQKETGKKGLNRDYAFDWSYSKGETFTLLIPGFYGGSSVEKVGPGSKFYEATEGNYEQAPLYFGDLTFTSGPIYIGAIIIFLFFIGLVVVKDSIKWPILIMTIISFILGWGKHFSIINDFLFDHLPYFNKFRTPMMAFCIAQVTMPLLGFLGIKVLYENWKLGKAKSNKAPAEQAVVNTEKEYDSKIWKKIQMTFYIVGGFCLLMAIMGPSFVDLEGASDVELRKGGNSNIVSLLKEDRASLLRKDALRSFIFIAAVFGLFWAWFNNKLKKEMAIAIIGVLAAIDLIGVDWRYLNWSDFTHDRGEVTDSFEPDQVDNAIMADKDPHFRILDLTKDPFNDNAGAKFHKMIGGYDPAKLSRYQDLISELISKKEYQDKALDILNCKYLIGKNEGEARGFVQRPTALGNAWFVSKVSAHKNAIEDMDALKKVDAAKEASFDQSFEANKSLKSKEYMVDSLAYAKLLSYHPDTMVYEVNNTQDGYLVFSEIYYENWKAVVDNEVVPLNKVDYTLRGLSVPAGKHKLKLYFDKGKSETDLIEKIISIAILMSLIILIVMWLATYFKNSPPSPTKA
ncbi:MAG: hypothetical protein IT245_02525 [Bacteroidia bacterium]|nr:hypothetical protein [Bacteroidia bacterium]